MQDLPKIYLYCIINSNSLSDDFRLNGLDNSPVYSIPYKDISGVACSFVSAVQDIRALAVEHEKIIESLMDKYTVLPMRIQTVFATYDKVISSIEKYYDGFKDNLARLSGKLEYGVKVIWPADRIRNRISADNDETGDGPLKGNTPASEYLKKKFTEYKVDKELKNEADKLISEIDRYFDGIAIEKNLQKLQTGKLLLNASYLVELSKRAEIFKAFKRLKEDFRELDFLFSGPWPAYNFIKLKG